MTHFDDLLPLYTKRANHPIFNGPISSSATSEFVFATDAHQFIRIPRKNLEPLGAPVHPAISAATMLEGYNLPEEVASLEIAELKRLLGAIPRVPQYEDCGYCRGEGLIGCSCCSNESDCDECDGSGQSEKQIGEVCAANHWIKVLDCFFQPEFIENLVTVAEHVGRKHATVGGTPMKDRKYSVVLFSLDQIVVGICPLMIGNWKNGTVYEYGQPLPEPQSSF